MKLFLHIAIWEANAICLRHVKQQRLEGLPQQKKYLHRRLVAPPVYPCLVYHLQPTISQCLKANQNKQMFFLYKQKTISTLEINLGLNPRRATQVTALPEFPPPWT
jgi:hypothetical protein